MVGYRDRHDDLRQEGISVIALSTDPLEKAKETVEEDRLPFPVAYGLRIPGDAEQIGAPWDEKRNIIQPSEFLLDGNGKVLHTTYSSGPVGRITAEDALTLLRFLKSRKK